MKREPISVVPFSDLSLKDMETVEWFEAAESPSDIFDHKVEHLADLLDCTEAEATRIILRNL
jgi:hypothetical protein